MKNKIKLPVLLLLILISTLCTQAQIDQGQYSQTSVASFEGKPNQIGLIVCNRKDNQSFVDNDMDDYVHRLLTPDFERNRAHDNIVVLNTFDTAKVHFFLHGVNSTNAAQFEYRVLEHPNMTLKPWTAISEFSDPSVFGFSEYPQMPYLGGYRTALTRTIVVDLRDKKTQKIISTALVNWKAVRPIVTNIYDAAHFGSFFQYLQHPYATQQPSKNIDRQQRVVSTANANLIFSLKATIYRRNQVQYQLLREDKVVVPWKENDYDNSFIWLKENRPGKYQLHIRYAVQPTHVAVYSFTIEPLWYQSNFFKIAIGILIAAFSGAFLFLILLVRQKRLTSEEMAKKTKLQLELKGIHAQLNPHFVFNALSSIQGLVNKQDIKGANSYLVEFAKLMRETLKTGHKDEIPLQKELEVLHTYIRLEQLRFGFEYEIVVDEDINTSEIDIPSLLLQPMVENAIKHGAGANLAKGKVSIHFKKINHNLLIMIKDNGNGFNQKVPTAGYGIKLTQERIELLNALKPEQKITLQIESLQLGTEISFTFNNWFL